ncbi:phospholipid/cholesterol/gamma-HCH transport system substrate-binding protein [Haloechinothrix alba]|uniref:Phospholipid/cholesterol/gamma-HCH transport system substrate-binding protein n=1 Tax=Haloechinothrix alba TaxID=664784 RepID=A0A239A9L2_9PSEU|nr:MlaD family protein [Haloechinothrix alba]SNR92317.1 phospholipid/cholesterol/gamma-HCH transport system substrate-binding protein [Haloechinothrix alba]
MRRIGQLWGRLRNIPGLGRDLLVLAVTVAVATATTAYIVMQYGTNVPWQDDRLTIAAEFDSAPSVDPSSKQEVRIAGVPVGKIEAADPQENGTTRIEMSVNPGRTVYDNARAVLRSKAPVNIMYISLDPGGPPGEPLTEGGTIPVPQTQRLTQPWELLNKLDDRTRDAITSLINEADAALATAPEHLPEGLDETSAVMNSFRPVVEELRSRRESISELVTSVAQVSTAVAEDDERLAQLTSSLQTSLSVLAERDEELGDTLEQVPGLSQDLEQAMTSTSNLTDQLDPTLDALHGASDELPSTLSTLSDTMAEAGRMVDAAGPTVEEARPVVADLRPLASDLNSTLDDLAPVTEHLPPATKRIVPWLDNLAAFVYQTSSAFSLSDENGGLGRGNFNINVAETVDGLVPGADSEGTEDN